MKTTVKSFFLLMFASATLAGCDNCGTTSILEPTVEDTQWLVYGNGDVALFNNAGDTVTYQRTGIYAQNVPGEGYSVTDDCIEKLNTQVTNIIEDKERKMPYLGTYVLKKPDSLIVKVGVGSKNAWEIKPTTDTPQTVEVGEGETKKTYTDVYVLTADSTAADSPKEVYFSKEQGFIKVELYNKKVLELIELKKGK
ncbi:hypothetical protein [Pontibacter litorisediminis]|uniref:hypothetical protein n=1 Tax=Pontibacter litorisediminis TaxID=1846260 RepID=UPI0023EB7BEA|nr:hypothetical protein [Pontibacter litorisediminis]